jgi:hypothetical protein
LLKLISLVDDLSQPMRGYSIIPRQKILAISLIIYTRYVKGLAAQECRFL